MALDFAKTEEEILEFWEKENIFQKTLEKSAPKGDFTYNDGPPFATGLPHYGHLLQSALKDAIPRYKTMRGFRVERKWGWDCHGLPIENIVEKELGTKSKKDIEKIGVKKFNDLCREKIFTYIDYWNKFIPRFGRWADMKNPYRTMDVEYMESEWWAFKKLYEKGLVYEDYRSMHICPRCETTLSQSEVSEGYKDVKDLAVTVKFPLADEKNISILAWTTTPWTLPGNVALAVGKNIIYALVQSEGEQFIVAKDLAENIFKGKEYSILKEYKGSDLAGKKYVPPFDSYVNDKTLLYRENAWKIYTADFITTDVGTGIAHEAPAFGAEDMLFAQQIGLPFIQHVGMNGIIAPNVKELSGLSVKPLEDFTATDVEVIKYLAGKNLLFSKEKYEHSYPHCWRCDTPLLNYATSSWFVSVEKIKDILFKKAENISWIPSHVKNGRWGDWLKGARDWSISRQRFWANTIPVWRCSDCKKDKVFGSLLELNEASGKQVADLHKDIVDEIVISCSCGSSMRRVPDVLDTWFDSGSVPFASFHYPFENIEKAESRIPVNFIAEAQDQISKWFYYQHILSGALFEKSAFSNVITSGIVLAEDGKKMSKRLNNYPDPKNLIDTYGADAVRLYILSSPVVKGENLNFAESGVKQISAQVIGRLVNSYMFYELYKDEKESQQDYIASQNILDQWIVAEFNRVCAEATKALDAYELDRATNVIMDFVEDFSTWYIRRSRDRYRSEESEDKELAVQTTRWILRNYAIIIAPLAPFVADWLWQRVKFLNDPESVHLASWPDLEKYDQDLLETMKLVRKTVSMGLMERSQKGIKVRQPLKSITLKDVSLESKDEFLPLIKDELNIREILFDANLTSDVYIDEAITPELKEEGELREIIRQIQDFRKEMGLKPDNFVTLFAFGSGNLNAILSKNIKSIMSLTKLNQFLIEEKSNQEFDVEKEARVDDSVLWLAISLK